MSEEVLTLADPHLIIPNRYQMRVDLGDLSDLDSIKEKGFLQTPKARQVGDRYELQFGHRRHAAWMLYRPGEPMPLIVMELTDREMAERAALENLQKPLTAIEKALGIQRYMDDFRMTQSEAGKLFGYETQGAVSNVLSLLRLPAEIRALVQSGDLPERLARALKSLAQLDPKAAVAASKAIAKCPADEREAQLYAELDRHVRGHGHQLNYPPWESLDWPPKPVPSGNVHIGDIPKCEGCSYNVRTDAGDVKDRGCIRKACFDLKLKAWAEAEAARVAAKAGISVAGPKEKVTILYDGSDYKKADFARAALATKHASLRTIAVYVKTRDVYGRAHVTGSEYVSLGCVDVSALRKAIAAQPKPKEPKHKRELTKYEQDRKKENSARIARAKQVRVLLSNAAPAFAPLVPPVLRELLFDEFRFDLGHSVQEAAAKWKKASDEERGRLIAEVLLRRHVRLQTYNVPTVDKATERIAKLAKAAKVRLPKGWNAAPSTNSKNPKPKAKGGKTKR